MAASLWTDMSESQHTHIILTVQTRRCADIFETFYVKCAHTAPLGLEPITGFTFNVGFPCLNIFSCPLHIWTHAKLLQDSEHTSGLTPVLSTNCWSKINNQTRLLCHVGCYLVRLWWTHAIWGALERSSPHLGRAQHQTCLMEIWHIAAALSSSLLKETGICGQGLWQATKQLWSRSEQRGQVILAGKKEGNSWRSKSWKPTLRPQWHSNFLGRHSCSHRNAWFSRRTQLRL